MKKFLLLLLGLVLPLYAQVPYQHLLKPLAENWLTYQGDFTGRHFSLLKQVTTDNIDQLVPIVRAAQSLGIGVNFSCYTDNKNGNSEGLLQPSDLDELDTRNLSKIAKLFACDGVTERRVMRAASINP